MTKSYVVPYKKRFRWFASQAENIQFSSINISQPATDKTYHSRAVHIKIDFPTPVKLRIGFSNGTFADMPIIVSDTPQSSYDTHITVPEDITGRQTLYFKTADTKDVQLPYQTQMTINIVPAPIYPDTPKLLRLRKFSYAGTIHRWDGLETE